MKMFTLRLKPKTIFGLILILAGIIVIFHNFLFQSCGAEPAGGKRGYAGNRCAKGRLFNIARLGIQNAVRGKRSADPANV